MIHPLTLTLTDISSICIRQITQKAGHLFVLIFFIDILIVLIRFAFDELGPDVAKWTTQVIHPLPLILTEITSVFIR